MLVNVLIHFVFIVNLRRDVGFEASFIVPGVRIFCGFVTLVKTITLVPLLKNFCTFKEAYRKDVITSRVF